MDAGGVLKFLQGCLPSDASLSSLDSTTLPKALRSGVILTNAVNSISPNIAPPPKPSILQHKVNIEHFLTACKRLGISQDDIFAVNDLYNEYNIPQVYKCLSALSAIKENKTAAPVPVAALPPPSPSSLPSPSPTFTPSASPDRFHNPSGHSPPTHPSSHLPPSHPPRANPTRPPSPPDHQCESSHLSPTPLPPLSLAHPVAETPVDIEPPMHVEVSAPPVAPPPFQHIGPPPQIIQPPPPHSIDPPPPQVIQPPPPSPIEPPPQAIEPPPPQPIQPPPQSIEPPPPPTIGPPPPQAIEPPPQPIEPPSSQPIGPPPPSRSPPPVEPTQPHVQHTQVRRSSSLVLGKPPSFAAQQPPGSPLRSSNPSLRLSANLTPLANRVVIPPVKAPSTPMSTSVKPTTAPQEPIPVVSNKEEVSKVISQFLEHRISPEDVVKKGILKDSPAWCPSKPTAPAPVPPAHITPPVSPPIPPSPVPTTPSPRPQPPKSTSNPSLASPSPSNPARPVSAYRRTVSMSSSISETLLASPAQEPTPTPPTPSRPLVNIKQVGGSLLDEISSRWQLKTSSIENVVDENKILSTDILSLHANLNILKEIGLKHFPEQAGMIYQIFNSVQTQSKAVPSDVYLSNPKLENSIRRLELLSLLSHVIMLKNILLFAEEHQAAVAYLNQLKEMFPPPPPTPLPTSPPTSAHTSPPEPEPEAAADEEGLVYSLEMKNGVETRELKAGTIQKLVELLFSPNADGSYSVIFMLIFRSFTDSLTVLRILFKAYEDNLSSVEELADAMSEKVMNKKKTRLRIVNIVKRWVENFWHDFEDDSVVEATKEFLARNEANDKLVAALKTNFEKKLIAPFNTHLPRPYIFSQPPPPSIVPSSARPGFEDMDPVEIARQLSLMEFDIFRTIQAKEMFSLSWSKKDKELKSPNLLAMIHKFNTISNWVSLSICRETVLKKRLSIVKRFTRVLEELIKLNNMNAVFEISSGLSSSSVSRLKITWAEFKDSNKTLDKVSNLTSPTGNFAAYRETIRRANPPCIPYLGVYLSDLTFIEEGNPDTTEAGLVNYCKFAMVAGVIQELQRYQQQPYNFAKVESIYGFLNSVKGVSEKECFELSLIAEPRAAVQHNS
ncbi:Ras guanine nucleotide exchange factor Q [Pelomyxa schiedti]|nr:Ras guanine nucleotide exchange factor Q [Pelomyxa schiedti]